MWRLMEPTPPPHRLDYRSPDPAAPARVGKGCLKPLARCFSLALLIVGVSFLLRAFGALMLWIREPNRFARSDASSVGPIALMLGVVSFGAGVRWAWFAFATGRDRDAGDKGT